MSPTRGRTSWVDRKRMLADNTRFGDTWGRLVDGPPRAASPGAGGFSWCGLADPSLSPGAHGRATVAPTQPAAPSAAAERRPGAKATRRASREVKQGLCMAAHSHLHLLRLRAAQGLRMRGGPPPLRRSLAACFTRSSLRPEIRTDKAKRGAEDPSEDHNCFTRAGAKATESPSARPLRPAPSTVCAHSPCLAGAPPNQETRHA